MPIFEDDTTSQVVTTKTEDEDEQTGKTESTENKNHQKRDRNDMLSSMACHQSSLLGADELQSLEVKEEFTETKSTRWSDEEDKKFWLGVKYFGRDWRQVASLIGTRNRM